MDGKVLMSRKYHFVAMLIERQSEGTPMEDGAVVARYEFDAISEMGAMRAASEWHNRVHPESRLIPGYGNQGEMNWQYIGRIEENRHYRHSPMGLVLLLVPLPPPDQAHEMSRLTTLIERLRQDSQWVRNAYRGHSPELLDDIEQYLRYRMDETGGSITDQLRRDADLVFDWPGGPAMLARALDVKPKELRRLLGRWRNMHCSTCNETHHILDERVQNGFDIVRYACRKCGSELVEVPRDPAQLRYDWRHSA
jgi:hypothetical protein